MKRLPQNMTRPVRPGRIGLFVACMAMAGSCAFGVSIDAVYFAQTHVWQASDPYIALVGNKAILIKAHVVSPGSPVSPTVRAVLTLNGQSTNLILTGPAVLPESIPNGPGVVQHSFNNSFTASIPKEWVKTGLSVSVIADTVATNFNLTIGAPTILKLNMFDIHFFTDSNQDYPAGWSEELEAKLPVAKLDLRRVRHVVFPTVVMPPFGTAPAIRCTSTADYAAQAGFAFDGELNAAGNWAGALLCAAGTRRRMAVFYANIYGVNSGGGVGGNFLGRGDGRYEGIFLHELGHCFNLPHCADDGNYPYKGTMYGISGDASAHVGPIWAFDPRFQYFIPCTSQPNNVGGRTVGIYKGDPMWGGGTGWQEPPYVFNHFSDYNTKKIQAFCEGAMIVWDDTAKLFAGWVQSKGAYVVWGRSNPVLDPIEVDVPVISVMAGASLVTPNANMVYPPIGPYVSSLCRLFDPSVAADRTDAESWLAPKGTPPAGGCDISLRIYQGEGIYTYMLPVSCDPAIDPTSWYSYQLAALNLPASNGPVYKVEMLLTPDAEHNGLPADPQILHTYIFTDPLAPLPNPMTFEVKPAALSSNSVTMTATLATDEMNPVQYYFENTTNGNNSGWILGRTWIDTDLTSGMPYGYRVKARDSEGNETVWSAVAIAKPPDMTAPSPNPMTFAVLPNRNSDSSVSMTASTASDISPPVQYYFENTANGASSGWISSTVWTNTGLTAGVPYGLRVKARDSFGNETAWSSISYITIVPDTFPPTPNPMTFAIPPARSGDDSIAMTATTATDPDPASPPVRYYFENTSNGVNSGWITSTVWTNSGLAQAVRYGYRVKARDMKTNETAWSTVATALIAPDRTPPVPNPMAFAVPPGPRNETMVEMRAITAIDPEPAHPPIKYYFQNTTNGATSGWTINPVWTNTGLTTWAPYGYRVKARDVFSNETAWSAIAVGIPKPDLIPPTPNPMTFAVPPVKLYDGMMMEMTATVAIDPEPSSLPVQYFFENTNNRANSGWILSPVWTNSGLITWQRYSYRVKARDARSNETAWSAVAGPATVITDVSGGNNNWNIAANWTASVPLGAVDAMVDPWVQASANKNGTPRYTGSLTLRENSTLAVLGEAGSISALQAANITMGSGSAIQVNVNTNIAFPAIALTGDASLESLEGVSDWQTYDLTSITGPHALILSGYEGNTFNFNASNSFAGLFCNALSPYTICAKAPGSLGAGDVTVNPVDEGDKQSAVLVIAAANAMADSAVLRLNGQGWAGTNSAGPYSGKYTRLDMKANDRISQLFIDGVRIPGGTYTGTASTSDWIDGTGTLFVTGISVSPPQFVANGIRVDSAGQCILTIAVSNGVKYQILYRNSMIGTNPWTPLTNGWTGGTDSGSITIIHQAATNQTTRFYRIQAQ